MKIMICENNNHPYEDLGYESFFKLSFEMDTEPIVFLQRSHWGLTKIAF